MANCNTLLAAGEGSRLRRRALSFSRRSPVLTRAAWHGLRSPRRIISRVNPIASRTCSTHSGWMA